MKLHNSVTNFFATKQQLQDRADKAQAEAAIEATAAEKAREAERIKAEKPTPTFSEHVLFELVEKVEKATGFLVFPNQVNNTQCATKLYDCLRRDRLPAAPDMLPDQSKPFMAMDGTVYGYPSKVVATATSGDNLEPLVNDGARSSPQSSKHSAVQDESSSRAGVPEHAMAGSDVS